MQVYTRLNDDEKCKSELAILQQLEQKEREKVEKGMQKAVQKNE